VPRGTELNQNGNDVPQVLQVQLDKGDTRCQPGTLMRTSGNGRPELTGALQVPRHYWVFREIQGETGELGLQGADGAQEAKV